MDNIKVSKCLAEDLEFAKKNVPFENIIDLHINKKWGDNYTKQFKELELEKLCEILINGYEVEETAEEIVEKVFNNLPDSEKDIYYKSGILFALNAYGIKIKGIND